MTLFATGRAEGGPFLRVARESGAAMKVADAVFFARHPKLKRAGYHPIGKLTAGVVEGLFDGAEVDRDRLARWRQEYWELLREAEITYAPTTTVMTVGDPVRKRPRELRPCSLQWIRVSLPASDRHYALRLPMLHDELRMKNPEGALAILADGSGATEIAVTLRKLTSAGLCTAHRPAPLLVFDESLGRAVAESGHFETRVRLESLRFRSCPEDWRRSFALWQIDPRRYRVEGRACETPGHTASVLVYPDVAWDVNVRLPAGPAQGHAHWRNGEETVDLLSEGPEDAAATVAKLGAIEWCHRAARGLMALSEPGTPTTRPEEAGLTLPVPAFRFRSEFREIPRDWRVGVVGGFELGFEPFFGADIDADLGPKFFGALRKHREEWSDAVDRIIDKVSRTPGEWGTLRLRATGEVGGPLFSWHREDPKGSYQYAAGNDIDARIPRTLEFEPHRVAEGCWRIGFSGTGEEEGLARAKLAVDWASARHTDDDFLDSVKVTWDLAVSGMTIHVAERIGIGSTWAPFGREEPPRPPEAIDGSLRARPDHGPWLERSYRRFRKDPPPDHSFGELNLLSPITSKGDADLLWIAREFVASLGGRES